ncbi:hypothetical protein P350_29940 [Burkholderia cepacia JBK9]|nr:hypothetical protein P350_29940 [Burkholderia cepacia JBK9]
MREMREVDVSGFAKSFAHRAPGGPGMASARKRRVSLTAGWQAARGRERRPGNACDVRMMARIADRAHRSAKARCKGCAPIAGRRAMYPASDSTPA